MQGSRSRWTHRDAHALLTTCHVARSKQGLSSASRSLRRGATEPARPRHHDTTTPWAMSRQKGMPSNEGRRRRRKAPSTRSARPRRCLLPHPYISAALRRTRRRRRTMRAVTWSQQAPPSPLREPPSTSRCGTAPARALACPSACATGAHAVRTVPKPVLRAGGRVVATAPAPSSARGSSAIIIAGSHPPKRPIGQIPGGAIGVTHA